MNPGPMNYPKREKPCFPNGNSVLNYLGAFFQKLAFFFCGMASDENPFDYKPLKVKKIKRRKKMSDREGGLKRKMRKVDVGVKEEAKEGLVEIFVGSSKRRSVAEETPKGDLCV